MPEFNLALIFSSFLAGVFTFFAPCTLPLIPAFLGIISGTGPAPFSSGTTEINPVRFRIFNNAVFYVLGFSAVFISFGVLFSYLGTVLVIREILEKIGGLFVVAFGLFLLGILKIPALGAEKQIHVPRLLRKASLINSFFLGALFALGWSPCVGPLLGSVLLLASTSGTVLEGSFLLVIFSLGLAVPFLITALAIESAFKAFTRWGAVIGVINKIAGIFLVVIGFLLITGQFVLIHNLFKNYFYNFPKFEVFVNRFL